MRISHFLLIAALWACQSGGTDKTDRNEGSELVQRIDSVVLAPVGQKVFELDSSTSYQTLFMDLFSDQVTGKRYLLYENRLKSSIQFYDFEKGLLARELLLDRDGPNGVGKMRGFYVKSLDSIFVMSSKLYQLVLVNGEGTVLKRYPLINHDTHVNDWSLPAIYTSSPGIAHGDVFTFVAYPETKPYEQKHPILEFDLSDSTNRLVYKYPAAYRAGDYWGTMIFGISMTKSPKGTIVYSFAADPSVYETDHKTFNEAHYAGSQYFERTESWDKDTPDGSEQGYVLRDYYQNILYDPYRHVYYRSVHLKLPALNVNNERNTIWNKPISVIILDENFRIIGETLLEQNKFDFRNWLVSEEGLLICESNPNNPDLEEGKLKFTVFHVAPARQ